MANIKVLSLEEIASWSKELNKLPSNQRDVYYSPEYYSLYQNYGDGKALCFVFEEDGELLLYPFLINSVNEIGYKLNDQYFDIQGAYGYNGVVSSSNNKSFIDSFHKCFDKWCLENKVIAEFTRFNPLTDNVRFASPYMQLINDRLTVKLDLTLDLDTIWMQQFNASNRNHIRKTEKKGVTVIESNDYTDFIRIYYETMKHVSAEEYYFFPESYFNEFKESFPNNGILCYAMLDGQPISGAVFMFSEDYGHYHLGARDGNFSKYAAQNLVFWYGVQKAKERGCKWFHFGGGTSGDENDSLLRYKSFFSQDKGEFWIGKRIHNQDVYDSVVEQWKSRYPEKYAINNRRLLGYREL